MDDVCVGCMFEFDKNMITCGLCHDGSYYCSGKDNILAGIDEETIQDLVDTLWESGFRPSNSSGSFLDFNSYTEFIEDQADIFRELTVKLIRLKTDISDNHTELIVDLIVDTVKEHWKIDEEE